jgi:putative DNA primase/helicase
LAEILGDYAQKSAPETFIEKRGGAGSTHEIAALKGARFVHSAEWNSGAKLNESLIKQLTGGDKMQARFLYQNPFEFAPVAKLWIATNHKPDIKGTDEGIWDRVKLIPFTVRIEKPEAREVVMERFRQEAPGILAWLVRGAIDYYASGKLEAPPAVVEATGEYREESDPLDDFFSSHCEIGPMYSDSGAHLYQAYMTWCGDTSQHAWSQTKFGRELTERGYTVKKDGSGNKRRMGLRAMEPGATRF